LKWERQVDEQRDDRGEHTKPERGGHDAHHDMTVVG